MNEPTTKPTTKPTNDRLQAIQTDYFQRLSALMTSPEEATKRTSGDRRFAAPAWLNHPPFSTMAALYLLNSEAMVAMTDALDMEPKAQQKLKFAVQQWVDATSPANYLATNPEAQQKMLDTKGESLRAGIEHLIRDMNQGRISQTDESVFELGKNLATTPGSVVFENDVFQLIQYAPSTPKVGSRPLLLVPPSINKFYIMDLQPESSLVKFAVDQGNTVFLISWRNPGQEQSKLRWDDYVESGILKAIEAANEIAGSDDLNVLGFCVGGTMTVTALAVLAARGQSPVHSLTLMTTLVDFANSGVLDIFINEDHVSSREASIGKGGILPGQELATTFSFLRPNDLVWNYVVKNYLKGENPPPFDILYWNSDSTNLPGPFFTWYLRNTYLENNLIKPNKVAIAGEKIDLRKIKMPVYAMGAREDHIVPWEAAWSSATNFGPKTRFVLGASGHVAGSINPASKNKRSHWVSDGLGKTADDWLARAKEVPGSWLSDWAAWLGKHQGGQVAAPKKAGKSAKYKVIEPAPGRYVRVRHGK